MRARRLAAAAAVALAAAATAVAVPAGTAAAATPGVGLQVQYPDGTTRTWCVAHRSGMTGADVLAVASPTYGSGPYAGFVLTITGQGTTPPTSSRYWAYWESPSGTAGGYTYSSSGVGSTHPAAGSVEAWIWNTSSTNTVPRPSAYATLCPNGA